MEPANALHSGDIVVVHGLVSKPKYNLQACIVQDRDDASEGRCACGSPNPESDQGLRPGLSVRALLCCSVPVRALHGVFSNLAVKRSNLLNMAREEDRQMLLTMIVWNHQLELRVARTFLLDRLRGEEGLCLEIARNFPPRETLGLTTGFANGRLVRDWSAVGLQGGRRVWKPIHAALGGRARVYGGEHVRDGIERIDCAVVGIGSGRFVVAGGCAEHPSRAPHFFSSAFLYDSITHVVTPLPDMPCARHGCGGAHIDGKVYVLGGEYAGTRGSAPPAPGSLEDHCVVLDVTALQNGQEAGTGWTPLGARLPPAALEPHGLVAFVPVAACWGRLVLVANRVVWAFNTKLDAGTWHAAKTLSSGGGAAIDEHPADLGSSAHGCVEWRQHIIVSSGRGSGTLDAHGPSPPCHVYAFTFLLPPDTEQGRTPAVPADGDESRMPPWSVGAWTHLGMVCKTNRVGADLAVVQGRLYISGGVHEERAGFDSSVARWDGKYSDLAPPPSRGGDDEICDAVDPDDKLMQPQSPRIMPDSGGQADKAAEVITQLSINARDRYAYGPQAAALRESRPPQAWTVIDDLSLPTAMHAHSAITIPFMS
jgi:hypothetical protein